MNEQILGIIPARGGSKGVPRKNIRVVAGKPLIAYTIESALASKVLTRFITTTDDPQIASVAESFSSPVLMRPAHLAADDTPMVPVVEHALDETPGDFEFVVVLQPTTPLRTGEDIDEALTLLIESGADSVISVYQVEDHHPARMYRLENNRLIPYEDEPLARLRQELSTVYHRNGAIYACKKVLVEQRGTLIGSDVRPYLMPRERSVNIDDELDLAFAEFLLSQYRRGANN